MKDTFLTNVLATIISGKPLSVTDATELNAVIEELVHAYRVLATSYSVYSLALVEIYDRAEGNTEIRSLVNAAFHRVVDEEIVDQK